MSQTPQQIRKAVAAASIGNTLEWYDFSIFAFFATYIGQSFFADGDETSALIKTFLLFAVGFIARPLGAIFLGAYGDKVGRKAALTMTIVLMAIGTLIIAVAPPMTMIGIGAPILLLIGRLLQGFSAGGEIGGASALLVESAPENKKATYSAWLQASMGVSNILAAVVGVTVTSFFSEAEIREWAWRLPFVVGLLIVPIGFYVRNTLEETDEFKTEVKAKDHHTPLKDLLKDYPLYLVAGILFSIVWTLCVYVLVIYMPTYYTLPSVGLGYTAHDKFLASLIGNIFMVIGCLMVGYLADKLGSYKIAAIGVALLVLAAHPLLLWLHSAHTLPNLIVVHSLFCLIVSCFAGVAPSILARFYPPAIRSTGMSLSYNIAAIFFAGFTPAILSWAVV